MSRSHFFEIRNGNDREEFRDGKLNALPPSAVAPGSPKSRYPRGIARAAAAA
jgi:hypothetical protein